MWLKPGLVLALLFVCSSIADIPDCSYFDTVDLTGSKRLPNGSYQYERLIIPPELTGEYNYEILADGSTETVKNHMRGCACKLGTCVRFCCHRNLMLVEDERRCSGDIKAVADFDPYVDVTLADGTNVTKHILDEFIVQEDLPVPCYSHYAFDGESDKWRLLENGTLLNHENEVLDKQRYCLQPHKVADEDGGTVLTLVAHGCYDPPPNRLPFKILQVITIICLILTIFVYLWLPKLRTLHGFCFVCYMLSIMAGFAMALNDGWQDWETKFLCQMNGYGGYFAAMAGFLWLTVISYDLWNSFRGNNYNVHRYTSKNRFLMYSLYAWGVAAVLTTIVILIDAFGDSDSEWLPGVAVYTCWFKTFDWSGLLYFFGPIALQLVFNTTMFILTFIRILEVKRELKNIAALDERQSRHNSHNQIYWLFLRLFVIMGVTWILEIIAYFVQDSNQVLTNFCDYVNCSQGIIIFILFVLKRSVLKLISDRIRGIESPAEEHSFEEEIPLEDRTGGAKNIGPSILH